MHRGSLTRAALGATVLTVVATLAGCTTSGSTPGLKPEPSPTVRCSDPRVVVRDSSEPTWEVSAVVERRADGTQTLEERTTEVDVTWDRRPDWASDPAVRTAIEQRAGLTVSGTAPSVDDVVQFLRSTSGRVDPTYGYGAVERTDVMLEVGCRGEESRRATLRSWKVPAIGAFDCATVRGIKLKEPELTLVERYCDR